MKSKRKWMAVILIPLFLTLSVLLFANIYSQAKLKTIQVSDLNLLEIEDGTYYGDYTISPVYAAVEVTVVSGKINNIKIIEHTYGLGKKAESITDEIVKKQTLQVDVVSGATMSSTAITKAVEIALQQGESK